MTNRTLDAQADKELQSLYIRLYMDEDVSARIVENLRQRGFDVECAHDVGLLHRDDDAELAFAISARRTFVTHNRYDFELRHQQYLESGRHHFGIIIARRRPRPEHVVYRLVELINRITVDEMQDRLEYI